MVGTVHGEVCARGHAFFLLAKLNHRACCSWWLEGSAGQCHTSLTFPSYATHALTSIMGLWMRRSTAPVATSLPCHPGAEQTTA